MDAGRSFLTRRVRAAMPQDTSPVANADRQAALLYAAACGLLIVVYVWHSIAVHYISDDGFISFRYAKNLLRGYGLVYNVGERVEGYTNFLWVVLLAATVWLVPMMTLPHAAQILGLLFGALTIIWVGRFVWVVRDRHKWFALLAGAFLAFHSGLAAWGTGGLETTFLAFLLFAAAAAYVSYLRSGRHFLLAPLLFAFATLARPDAIVLFAASTLHAAVTERRRRGRLVSGRLVAWLLVFAAVYLPYFAWRVTYYGDLLPNTLYAKVGGGMNQHLRGIKYLAEYVRLSGVIAFIPAVVLLLRRERQAWRDYLAQLVATYAAYIVYVGGDGLAYFRFVTCIAPMLYVLVTDGFADLYERAARRLSWRGWALNAGFGVVGAAAVLLTGQQTIFPLLLRQQYRWYEPHSGLSFPGLGADHSYNCFDTYFVDRQAAAAQWLQTHAAADALVASTPAGSIAYHMDLQVIDMLGLTDRHIAHTGGASMGTGRAGHEKGDGQYVLSRSPDYILLGNVAVLPEPISEVDMPRKLVQKSERQIWAAPEFHEAYERMAVKLNDEGVFRYFTFYKRKTASDHHHGVDR